MKRPYPAALLAFSAASLYGQASVSGPSSEYIFDPGTNAIRAIVGAPGSAYLGKSVIAGLQFGSVAPNGISALVALDGAADFVADLTQSSTTPLALVGAIESPDQILWAQDSSGAVLFSSRGRALQFVTQLNQQPMVQSKIDLSAMEPVHEVAAIRARTGTPAGRSPILLLAVDPEAGTAVIAIGGAGQSNLYLVKNGISPQLLLNLQSASAAAFASDGSLYVLDAVAGQVWAVRNPTQSPQIQSQAAPPGVLGHPVAIAVQANLLYVASSPNNRIGVYNLTTLQELDELALDSSPTTLDQFSATSFLVNARRNPTDPVLLLETSPTRKITFIPSGANQ